MKQRFFKLWCVVFPIFLNGCRQPEVVAYPQTLSIDTAEFHDIKKKFNLQSVVAANKSLGGLVPAYPIAIAFQHCQSTKDTDWLTGGFICVIQKPIVKIESHYVLINNRTDLKKMFAPITSEEEAMAYAILYTKGFPILNSNFFKKDYTYFNYKPSLSYSIKKGDEYTVKLFSYQSFGCTHPYTEMIYTIKKNGDLTKK